MLTAIDNSIVSLCEDILGVKLKRGKSLGKDFHKALVSITCNDKKSDFYLFLKQDNLKEFAYGLLGEDDLGDVDLSDLCKEVANLIIGQAKAILDDKYPQNSYKLGTPKYFGKVSSAFDIKFDDYAIYKLKNRTFLIGVKS